MKTIRVAPIAAGMVLVGLTSVGCAVNDGGAMVAVAQPNRAPSESSAARAATHVIRDQPRLPSEPVPTGIRSASLPDGDLGIDCAPIRAAIAARRSAQQWAADADAEALQMLNESPHQYVLPDYLVSFLLPPAGHGLETTTDGIDQQKAIIKMKLCDQLYRETVTRQFVARYPSFR